MKPMNTKEAIESIEGSISSDTLFRGRVSHIIEGIRSGGDQALRGFAAMLKDPSPEEIPVEGAVEKVDEKTAAILRDSADNISLFAKRTAEAAASFKVSYGSHTAGLRWQPVNTAGCYVPGGRYPLASTALMTVCTASAAGVQRIVVCSPDSSPVTLAACEVAGADRFFRIGGAQAIAAMAFGTETIPRADVIAGPGNSWVTEAKRQLQGTVGIDMLAGPSEVALLVDGKSCGRRAAVDLLAQAEHDPEASAWCISTVPDKLSEISALLKKTGDSGRIKFVLAGSYLEAAAFCNLLAPEHLQLSVANPDDVQNIFTEYGALFLGESTPVPLGDYAAGPNHTLPTGGSARFKGGLTPFTFLRPQGWVKNTGGELPRLAGAFASLEGLKAHWEACRLRFST